MSVKNKSAWESGQAAVEFAIACPILIFIALFAVQAAWVMYSGACLGQATQYAAYAMQASDVSTGEQAAQIVREKLIEAEPVLASGDLMISNASIVCEDTQVESAQLEDADFEEYRIATKNKLTTRMRVKADVSYEPVQLFSLGDKNRFYRAIDSSMVIDETFELG